jgi:type IV pilus assembly protein PilA
MLVRHRERLRNAEDGFTLIELMVVVMIIAILIAIAVPTFLGARRKSQDRAAQSNARQALSTAKTHYTDGETFVGFTAAAAGALEPSLTWADVAAATAPAVGSVGIETAQTAAGALELVVQSASGKFFCLTESTTGTTKYGQGAAIGDVDTIAECNALAATAAGSW